MIKPNGSVTILITFRNNYKTRWINPKSLALKNSERTDYFNIVNTIQLDIDIDTLKKFADYFIWASLAKNPLLIRKKMMSEWWNKENFSYPLCRLELGVSSINR